MINIQHVMPPENPVKGCLPPIGSLNIFNSLLQSSTGTTFPSPKIPYLVTGQPRLIWTSALKKPTAAPTKYGKSVESEVQWDHDKVWNLSNHG